MSGWVPSGELLPQLLLLLLAFVLSAVIGVERERQFKSAGLRTHILVGLGSALFTLVSAFGFTAFGLPATDPGRIAAQVVTGIGFVGAGVIFVNRGNVVGLTTAASIWMTAAVGMACGAGLPLLAIAGTALHLLALGSLPTAERMIRQRGESRLVVRVDPSGASLGVVLDRLTGDGLRTRVDDLRRLPDQDLELAVHIRGSQKEADRLLTELGRIDGVVSVKAGPMKG
ncbi:MgtC/SapB family protein [Leifsonia shinshuensis]|uniref:MgtC/SapB family protein n=1 Tax=Leifsonia shinshuensis TaxID=150026 RepID=A0A7G6Y5K3_9MICO|nr:MgtC/SapB family protein [Leifsonia shinshuensis]QNE33768.1 MgtC/SapB family protein [Leifsonia shinshuensis]